MTGEERESIEALINAAAAVRANAHAPYSRLRVGAAVRDGAGRVWVGANVENASYGLTVCAERVALCTAVSSGAQEIRQVVVVTERGHPPCGACRQVIQELAPDATMVIATPEGIVATMSVADLLPRAFEGFTPDS